MELTPEERERIYLEEKTRHEARTSFDAASRKSNFRRYWRWAIWTAAGLFGLFLLLVMPEILARVNLENSTEARSALVSCEVEMSASALVLSVGKLESLSQRETGWRMTFAAVFKSDTGLIERGTLICNADRNGREWTTRLNR